MCVVALHVGIWALKVGRTDSGAKAMFSLFRTCASAGSGLFLIVI